MKDKRKRKLSGEIKKIIGNAILFEMKDPRIPPVVTITDVELAGDMKKVNIYISSIGCEDVDELIALLNKASGFFRMKLGKELKTYNTPKPHFIYDNSIEKSLNMDKFLRELNKDE